MFLFYKGSHKFEYFKCFLSDTQIHLYFNIIKKKMFIYLVSILSFVCLSGVYAVEPIRTD